MKRDEKIVCFIEHYGLMSRPSEEDVDEINIHSGMWTFLETAKGSIIDEDLKASTVVQPLFQYPHGGNLLRRLCSGKWGS